MSESSNRPPLSLSPGQWSFTRWKTIGQLEALEVHHPLFQATLFLQGAHLASFKPQDESDWLWMSPSARYEPGRAIRGGIPVCWPWFGDPARNAPEVRKRIHTDKAHGFARTALWKLEDVRENAHEVKSVCLWMPTRTSAMSGSATHLPCLRSAFLFGVASWL